MARIQKKLETEDYTSEIGAELDQLIALGEILRHMPTPAETRDEFFPGLADLIARGADRINDMLTPTYNFLCQRSKERGES